MLLTITYRPDRSRGECGTDLGFLLFKNPKRPQVFALNYGKAYVFYPEVQEEVCTAALLLDIDPIDLARGKVGSKEGGLFDYVNDRPYVSSSFLSTAIARVFGTALSGRCDKRPELAERELNLTANITMLPCRGDTQWLRRVFEPLGYQVSYETSILEEDYPSWGESRYVNLSLAGTVRLQALLRHLYVLIPVFDRRKHYWFGRDEVDKLLRHGEGWLECHPERQFIINRYMGGVQTLARLAMETLQLDRMDDGQSGAVMQAEAQEEESTPKLPSLNTRRLAAVVQALKEAGATSVIDLGCGEGKLLALLLKDRSFSRLAGMDVSCSALERAAQRLQLDRLPEVQKNRLSLFQSSLTYKDKRFCGYDAACVIEVLEHLDPTRLIALEQILFGETHPGIVVITTPNVEYNALYPQLPAGAFRHGDHRFEWTREQFQAWALRVAQRYGYNVTFHPIGDEDQRCGAPTQMGVFTLCC